MTYMTPDYLNRTRAKFINEKFEEESDPIKDMNIGGINHKQNFKNWNAAYDYIISILPNILKTEKIPDDIIHRPSEFGPYFKAVYYTYIDEYITKYITVNNCYDEWDRTHTKKLRDKLIDMGYPKNNIDR